MLSQSDNYEECQTIFYQGSNCSQTQATHYTGGRKTRATTGEIMWSEGRNHLKPLNVIQHLFIGKEIADANLNTYTKFYDYLNPVKLTYTATSSLKNYLGGVNILPPPKPTLKSVKFHTPNFSKMSYGQKSDIISHHSKYKAWKKSRHKKKSIILWGVSRGTAATFCAFAKYHYPEVKLVVLEGAIDSMENVIKKIASNAFKSESIGDTVVGSLNTALSYLNRHNLFGYKSDGESPLKAVNDFPENIPVVFITSEKDTLVNAKNTENIATKLAERGKNDVFLLKLKNSSHPCYMYDDKDDRDMYEAFIHAIYKKYFLQHDPLLACKGEAFINDAFLSKNIKNLTIINKFNKM